MNIVTSAIQDIYSEIPLDILEMAFNKRERWNRQIPIDISQSIRVEVVIKRVLMDLNMTNGIYTQIPLSSMRRESVSHLESVYHIPKEVTGGRGIISVINLQMGPGAGYPTNPAICGTSVMGNTVNSLLQSQSPRMITLNARLELINENTVMVYSVTPMTHYTVMNVLLEHDDELSEIRPRASEVFRQLIVLATKAYIYNTLIIPLSKGELLGGADLGIVKSTVEEYKDSNREYKELLKEKASKIIFMNSRERMYQFVETMFTVY